MSGKYMRGVCLHVAVAHKHKSYSEPYYWNNKVYKHIINY